MKKILIVGGTFCPPHQAHMAIITAVQNHFAFDQVIFVPCKEPVLDKAAGTSVTHRIAMLRLALKPFSNFILDLCEIERDTPSYMITTLLHFRKKLGEAVSITLFMGMDNFLQFPRWHHWQDILTLSHLLVVNRANITADLSPVLQTLLANHKPTPDNNLSNKTVGTIELFDAGHYDISSTYIRSMIQHAIKNKLPTDKLITSTVRDYIDKHKLFLS
ncbi:MAG: nicotinate (nicotinamide) nucleotide adenylyltransferase [Legionellaceae bacterium]|nr:nicotinate (nicotinamide) nucleotide adenylyltransferase [Legionellaceae bacterium]